jgi:hypothetical protein
MEDLGLVESILLKWILSGMGRCGLEPFASG